jgi:hypothetical protein
MKMCLFLHKFLQNEVIFSCFGTFLQRERSYNVRKRKFWDNRDVSFFLFVPVFLRKYRISFSAKGILSFMLNYRASLKKECFSFFKDFFVFIKVQKKLKLYESAFRDIKMYVPDLFCV